jgi:hypothetical protein
VADRKIKNQKAKGKITNQNAKMDDRDLRERWWGRGRSRDQTTDDGKQLIRRAGDQRVRRSGD